jgi:hypothetical protein
MLAGHNATTTASSSMVSEVDLGSFEPVRRSAVDERLRHLAMVFWLTPWRWRGPSGFLHSAGSLEPAPDLIRGTASVFVALA